MPFSDRSDVVSALSCIFNRVMSGEVDHRIGHCLGGLAGHILKAIQADELDKLAERIAQLEAARSGADERNQSVQESRGTGEEAAGGFLPSPAGEDPPGFLDPPDSGGDDSGLLAEEDPIFQFPSDKYVMQQAGGQESHRGGTGSEDSVSGTEESDIAFVPWSETKY
jgi:hypothetical protein